MFFKQIHYRIKITLLIIILLFLVIIGKVFYIQVFSYKKITSQNLKCFAASKLTTMVQLQEKQRHCII